MSKSLVFTIVILVAVMIAGMPVTVMADIREGLISVWSLNEGSGTTTADLVGGNDGVFIGTDGTEPTWVTPGFLGDAHVRTYSTMGTAGGVLLNTDGILDSRNVPVSLMPETAFSVSAWVKADSFAYYGAFFYDGFWTGDTQSGFMMHTLENGSFNMWLRTQNASAVIGAQGTAGSWYHVVCTYDSVASQIKIYVNGSQKSSGPLTGLMDWDPVPMNIMIGAYNDDNESYVFEGEIDDVGMWNRALTPAEVAGLYDGGELPSPILTSIPVSGATLIPLDQVLSWELIKEMDLIGYDVWFGTDANEISPNYDFTKVLSLTTDTSYAPTGLEFNTAYYWQVDVHEANDVGTIFHEGWLWNFTTAPPWPVITSDPLSQAVPAGVSAQLSVGGVNMEVFEWYKLGDPNVLLVSDGVKIIGAETDTLTITDFQLADEGRYYCVVKNDEGSDTSNAAQLAVARLVGYWPMDGNLLDASGLGNDGTPVGDPTYVTGIIGSDALNLDGNDYVVIDGVADNIPTNDITMSGWVKTTDKWADWLSCNTADYGNVAMLDITDGYTNLYEGASEAWSTTMVSDGQWHLLTYTRIGSVGSTYVDGTLEATHTADFILSSDNRWSIGQEWDGAGPSDFLTGDVDDVRIYNYGLDHLDIADLYLDAYPDGFVCLERPEMDFDGNCKVDIDDFVTVTAAWLNCNLVPTCLP